MALTTEARKPFYAAAGAVDLAVEKTRELPTEVVARAVTLVPKTTALYGELISRGEKLLGSIRRSSSTKSASAQVKSASAKAKAATTSATKAVKATAKAVEDAADKIG